jgi:hypothetical protein
MVPFTNKPIRKILILDSSLLPKFRNGMTATRQILYIQHDILQLTNQYWDFVIDVSCYYPAKLDEFIDQMEGRIGRYIFISTVSVYQLDEAIQDQSDYRKQHGNLRLYGSSENRHNGIQLRRTQSRV